MSAEQAETLEELSVTSITEADSLAAAITAAQAEIGTTDNAVNRANLAALNAFNSAPTSVNTGPGTGEHAVAPVYTGATVAAFDPDASNKIDNHGEVYISMDMHKLTIGSDLDGADKLAGGLADPGFDGIGIDDVAEGLYGTAAKQVRYDGDFGVAKVAISYGDNKGDAEWAAGFNFNVEPVTFGAGFDSKGVMSLGMGFSQGQISMNALFSQDSDTNEADNEALGEVKAGVPRGPCRPARSQRRDHRHRRRLLPPQGSRGTPEGPKRRAAAAAECERQANYRKGT